MIYEEFAPSAALARCVQCFWTMTATDPVRPAPPHRVLPDGCIDIIIDLHDRAASPTGHSSASLVGTMRTAITAQSQAGVETVAVRFRPGGAALFFALPMREITDLTIPLADIWKGTDGELVERCAAATTARQRVAVLDAFLTERLPAAMPNTLVAGAVRRLERSGGNGMLASLAADLGASTRQLERLFGDHVGIPPKAFARVVRLQRAVGHLLDRASVEWHDVVYGCGYYDQPHFIHEFNALAGVSPGDYLRERGERVAFVQSPPEHER